MRLSAEYVKPKRVARLKMSECKEKRLIIVQGDFTGYGDVDWLTLRPTSDVWDLSTMHATFELNGIVKQFDDLTEPLSINYEADQTAAMPLGDLDGVLRFYDANNKPVTVDNLIPVKVVKYVHGDAVKSSNVEMNIEVKQGDEVVMEVLVEAGVSVEVGSTETLPPGSEAYVQNVGTPNHLVLKFGIPEGEKGEDGAEGPEGPEGPAGKDGVDGKDAKINGVNTLTLTATNGVQLNQSGDTANIDGKPLQDGISDINSKIPSSASSSNKLADVDFVNSSINNMAAFYVTSDVAGDPFPTRASLVAGPWYFRGQLRQPTQNDYALVTEDETHDDMTSRFMYDGTQWVWQYTLNNTQFTQAQIDAINSGITESLVNKIGQNESSITTLQNTKQDNINDLATIRSGAAAGATALQGVQIDGTDLTIDANKKVEIPMAGGTKATAGVIWTTMSQGLQFGTTTGAKGRLEIYAAQENHLIAKNQKYTPVVPANLDIAIREGLGNNSLTWTEAYKTSARNTIGAEAQSTIQTLSATDSITLADNTIYNGGEQTALTIALPATVDVSFLCEIDFTSGATPATLAYPNTIKWLGDDVANNVFVPVASKRYTIICAYDGVNYRFTVKGV